ncbi:MAG: hypothetical protein ACYDEU_08790 [Vulcanimicrobiaceae bacterium]
MTQYRPTDWTTGLIIGGYQPGSYYPWLYSWEEPEREGVPPGLQCVREHEGQNGEDGPEPGIESWGETTALDRLYRGLDPILLSQLPGMLKPEHMAEMNDLLDRHRWSVLFDGMPIKDAADLTKFMLDLGCNFGRFSEGIPRVGGDPDVVIVTRTKIHWTHRKSIGAALAGAQARTFARSSGESEKGSAAADPDAPGTGLPDIEKA